VSARCEDWCGIWYWTTKGKNPPKATKPYSHEPAFLRMRALYFCSRPCAVAGQALNPRSRP